ncbi:MAG TPA: hypothetical protein VFX30_11305, partial [bacterium]|nr:hypothetical protein [bacterium]
MKVQEPVYLGLDLGHLQGHLGLNFGYRLVRQGLVFAPIGHENLEALGRQSDLGDRGPELIGERFLPDVLGGTWTALLRAPVIVMSFLSLCRNGASTVVTGGQAEKWKGGLMDNVILGAT